MATADETAKALKHIGQQDDHSIPLGETALLLASLDHPTVDIAVYRAHLNELAHDAQARLGPVRQPRAVAAALAEVIANKHGYLGDSASYDDPQNADIVKVIDRRKGLPVAIGLIYLEIAGRLDTPAQGLNAPGHFVISIGAPNVAIVCDPFNGGVALGPLRQEGRPELQPVSRRDVILRLINNLRSRNKDAQRHLTLCERMVLIAPKRADLWLDAARANEAVGKLRNATGAYQATVRLSGMESQWGREATIALNAVKRRLN